MSIIRIEMEKRYEQKRDKNRSEKIDNEEKLIIKKDIKNKKN